MQSVNPQPDKKELRNFGLLTGVLIMVFFGLLLPWLFDHDVPRWPWIASPALIVWALALPTSLKPVYRIWMTIGLCLGWINTRIILTVMFFCIILPVGAVMRMTGKDPMARSFDRDRKSYRVPCSVPDKKHVERPY